MWNAWSDCRSKHWTISDASPVILMSVTLRYIYTHRFFSHEVRESLFLQLLPESHHCMLNETYMLFFQISSSEFTSSFTRKWIVMVSYFPFHLLIALSAFVTKFEFLLDILKYRQRLRVMYMSAARYTIWFNRFPSSYPAL